MSVRFWITVPSELAAGIRGTDDLVTMDVASGDAGGELSEFADTMRETLAEWYDTNTVAYIQEDDNHVVVAPFRGESRVVMSDFTCEHFRAWLGDTVIGRDQRLVADMIYQLLYDHPNLTDKHSWPEIRNLAERNRELGLS